MNKYPSKYNEKRKDIQLIKIAQKQLGMDDDTYRDLLFALTRKRSSTELDFAERRKVLDHLKACGFKVVAGKNAGAPVGLKPDLQPLMGKIGALLADMKLPWRYLSASRDGSPSMLKRLAGVDKIEWAQAEGLRAIIAALAKRQAKMKGSDE